MTPVGRPKSLSRESAFTEATDEVEAKRERVRTLAAAVAERAERENALYRTIGIKVVTPPFDVNTRARSLPGPVADADLVREVALDLLAEFRGAEVRKVGVRVSNLSFASGEQASLDGFEAQGTTPAAPTVGSTAQPPTTPRPRPGDEHAVTGRRSSVISCGMSSYKPARPLVPTWRFEPATTCRR